MTQVVILVGCWHKYNPFIRVIEYYSAVYRDYLTINTPIHTDRHYGSPKPLSVVLMSMTFNIDIAVLRLIAAQLLIRSLIWYAPATRITIVCWDQMARLIIPHLIKPSICSIRVCCLSIRLSTSGQWNHDPPDVALLVIWGNCWKCVAGTCYIYFTCVQFYWP